MSPKLNIKTIVELQFCIKFQLIPIFVKTIHEHIPGYLSRVLDGFGTGFLTLLSRKYKIKKQLNFSLDKKN